MLKRMSQIMVLQMAIAGFAFAQTPQWQADKVYYAGDPGSPNSLSYVEADGTTGFPGWTMEDTNGIVVREAPSDNAGGIGGLEAGFNSMTAGWVGVEYKDGKEKHRTGNWPAMSGAATTRTGLLWRIYIPSSPTIEKLPSLQIRTHNRRHTLDFDPDATNGTGMAKSGWVPADGSMISSGGKENTDGSRFLPMTMNEWHTIRMEVGAGGNFEVWIDEEDGLSDVRHATCLATKDGSGDYIEIGVRSSISNTQYWTNYLAWGQDTSAATGNPADNHIEPLLSPSLDMEICGNGLDDDYDGYADCDDVKCECEIYPEDNLTACTNARDDDLDGLADCDDPDCAGFALCDTAQPRYVLTLVRQVGHWQNSCTSSCNAKIYVSVYDEQGNPLNGVTVSDPIRSMYMTTANDPGQGIYGQGGHARSLTSSLSGTYQFHVSSDSSGMVASDVTPPLVASVAPDGTQYTWQLEFMRVSDYIDPPAVTPEEPTYIFDAVEMNTVGGGNVTLDMDSSDLYPTGGSMFVQTFVANCDRVVSARFELTRGFLETFQYQASIHPLLNDPPTSLDDLGEQLGATRYGPQFMIDSEWWTQMLNWPVDGEDAVTVVPGSKYAVLLQRADIGGPSYPFFNAFHSYGDFYPDGTAYRIDSADNFVMDHASFDLTGYVVGVSTGDVIEPLSITSAASRCIHYNPSNPIFYDTIDLPLTLDGEPVIEPRMTGSTAMVVVELNDAVPPVTCPDLIITNGTCQALAVSGTTLVVEVEAFNTVVTVDLVNLGVSGDSDVQVALHKGDVTQDGIVNLSDLLAVKGHLFDDVDQSNAIYDITCDLIVNLSDLLATKGNLFQPIAP